MSVPPPRQPKIIHEEVKHAPPNLTEPRHFLVTLEDGTKLVVTSDAYHGLLMAGELFRCVFCETEMVRDVTYKERHKTSDSHCKMLELYPYLEEFKENLIRKLNKDVHYCAVCNIVIASHYIYKHITTEVHIKELQMAIGRALPYKQYFCLESCGQRGGGGGGAVAAGFYAYNQMDWTSKTAARERRAKATRAAAAVAPLPAKFEAEVLDQYEPY